MSLGPYRIQKLIQDLLRNPAAAAEFASDQEPAYDAYALTDEERALMREGTLPALHKLGMHPNLQMKFMRLKAPRPPGAPGLMDAYLERLQVR